METQIYVAVIAFFLFVALIVVYLARPDGSADAPSWAYLWHRIWRRIAFWAGDVRLDWQWYFFIPFPLISWTHHEYAVTYEELLEVCKILEPGDLMLATKKGYVFSNFAIPGCFKHAGIIVAGPNDDTWTLDPSTVELVEAISEGVVRRHLLWARGDLMIFLRPRGMHFEDRDRAVRIANKIVGCRYDAEFDFNLEAELKHLEADERDELARVKQSLKAKFDIAFSCTEVAAAAWWHKRTPLGIVRQRVRGRMCIVADQFVNRSFQIVWTNVTAAQAEKAGLGEEGLRELEAYWEKRKRELIK